ncbi:damage-inducible protein D [Comamonas aquatica]|uniref:damage-inducible protein D n=1 Tax=Comamonas aquatica TaxID=225991 RepID=UPI0028D64823|nr:damage-inducible protein D [Comamonas aquatica]
MAFDLDHFENTARQNGVRYWYAHEYMRELGYESWQAFHGVILKAQASCARLEMDTFAEFIPDTYLDPFSGAQTRTVKLTRFGCLLVAMHADERKPEVAAAKIALATIADRLISARLSQGDLGRIETRDDLKAAELALASAAKGAGVQNHEHAFFKDAGIRGMYNRSLQELKQMRGLGEKDTAYDFMGLTELAGNLFRVTQTAERLKQTPNIGLRNAQRTAHTVGAEVRGMMIHNSGKPPEALPVETNIKDVKRQLRNTAKEMKKLDAPPKKSKAQKS